MMSVQKTASSLLSRLSLMYRQAATTRPSQWTQMTSNRMEFFHFLKEQVEAFYQANTKKTWKSMAIFFRHLRRKISPLLSFARHQNLSFREDNRMPNLFRKWYNAVAHLMESQQVEARMKREEMWWAKILTMIRTLPQAGDMLMGQYIQTATIFTCSIQLRSRPGSSNIVKQLQASILS